MKNVKWHGINPEAGQELAAEIALTECRKANAELLAALIDATAMLEHYTSGKPDNWDGSTKGQALSTIREARAAIAKAKGE